MRTTTTDCTKADVAVRMERVRKTDEVGDQEVVALDCSDLTVGSDEIVALIGPSGSGKTTLCSIAGGILAPTDGTVVVGGEDISGYSSKQLTEFRRRSVGFVFQTVNLVDRKSVVWGKRGYVCVDLGGRRLFQKKKY